MSDRVTVPDSSSDTPKKNDKATWLVMVYMQAGDSSQLDSLAVRDLFEMEQGVRDNPNVEVVVQIHRKWPAVPQRYLLKAKRLPIALPGPVNAALEDPKSEKVKNLIDLGQPEALEDFLSAGLTVGKEIDARYYSLVLWGHNFGLGFGRDHHDPLKLSELERALATFTKARGDKLDLLATNTCTMSYIEAAYQLRNDVRHMVASQVFVPNTGLPYNPILSSIGRHIDPPTLGRMMVDLYVRFYNDSPSGEKVAMALLDLSAADKFAALLANLARDLQRVIGHHDRTNLERLAEIRDAFLVNPSGDVRPVLDLNSLARDLSALCNDAIQLKTITGLAGAPSKTTRVPDDSSVLSELAQSANELASASTPDTSDRQPAVARNKKAAGQVTESPRLVVHHDEHPDLNDLNGIGVFAPFVVDKTFLNELELDDRQDRKEYEKLQIFQSNGTSHTAWTSLVYDRLRFDEPDEIVDSRGIVRAPERTINQMLFAISAAFNQLDRLLPGAEARVVHELQETGRKIPDIARMAIGFGPPKLQLVSDFAPQVSKDEAGVYFLRPGPTSSPATAFEVQAAEVIKVNNHREPALLSMLARLENAVRLVERTTKRVATNATFGLGPPNTKGMSRSGLVHLGPKPQGFGGFDQNGPKPQGFGGFDQNGPKPQGFGGFDQNGPKPQGFGLDQLATAIGGVSTFLSSDTQIANLAVSTLFAEVAQALGQLEGAVRAIERSVAEFLFEPGFFAILSPADYNQAVRDRFARVFGIMRDSSAQARRTIRLVLAHPLYGLGPGPEGLEQAERDEIAMAAGLNRINLALL